MKPWTWSEIKPMLNEPIDKINQFERELKLSDNKVMAICDANTTQFCIEEIGNYRGIGWMKDEVLK